MFGPAGLLASSASRYSRTARDAPLPSARFFTSAAGTNRSRFASALMALASIARPSPPTNPSHATLEAPIHKTDAAQLVLSAQWCDEQLAAGTPKPAPVFATNVAIADRPEAIAFGPRLLNESLVMDLLDSLRKVVLSLTYDGPLFTDPVTVSKKLAEQRLNGGAIISRLPKLTGKISGA